MWLNIRNGFGLGDSMSGCEIFVIQTMRRGKSYHVHVYNILTLLFINDYIMTDIIPKCTLTILNNIHDQCHLISNEDFPKNIQLETSEKIATVILLPCICA